MAHTVIGKKVIVVDLVTLAGAAIYGAFTAIAIWYSTIHLGHTTGDGIVENIEQIGSGGVILVAGALIFRWLIKTSGHLVDELQEENARLTNNLRSAHETIEVLRNGKERRKDAK